MKRLVAIADRAAPTALKLVAAFNVLFVIAFFVVALLLSGKARAEAPACTGVDMLAELANNDPALLKTIEEEARKTLNGEGLLWKLEKPGQRPSWLYGTMHVTDPRVTTLEPAAQKAFDGAHTLVMETTDVLDPKAMMASLMKQPELMMFTDATTLPSLLSPEDAKIVNAALEARGIPAASIVRMKPWMLSSMVALPACELNRKASGAPVLDILLAQQAKAAGKQVKGLETAADQLSAMASLPMEFHIQGLVETLKLGSRMDDVIETMVVLYQRGDTGMFWPLVRNVLPSGASDDSGYAAFEEAMVTTRNKTMAERAAPILDQGDVFMAVGAMHLPGPDGLVELFRKAGYTVSVGDR
ncbi:TraB/GumN family protein [Aminobacter sp. HY435]|uniref:TraB/GumN family protein n=1 Tax=Aminobacter sp. HY435 TaxID=2970917 RepID=UPI0022B9A8C1|nr:TraB/GumN family protein [Aminobacter sp. HY435]